MTDTYFDEPVRLTMAQGEGTNFLLRFDTPATDSQGVVERDLCGGPVRGAVLSFAGWSNIQVQFKAGGNNYDAIGRFIGQQSDGRIGVIIVDTLSEQMVLDGQTELLGDLFVRNKTGLRTRLAPLELQLDPTQTRIDAPFNN